MTSSSLSIFYFFKVKLGFSLILSVIQVIVLKFIFRQLKK